MKTPRQYQLAGIARATRQNLLLSDACGLGKTLQAIETAKAIQARIGKLVLIVTPSETVKLQWLVALQDQEICHDCILWLDSKTKIDRIVVDNNTIILTHYEALRKHVAWLQSFYFSIVVADEAHRIKNRKALRTIAIKSLKAYRKVALTGTPGDRNPADVWSILNWLDPQFFSSYWRFFESHVNYRERELREIDPQTGKHRIIKELSPQQPKNANRLAQVLHPYCLRRSKEDVRSDLPLKIEQYIDLEMPKAQLAIYQKIANANDPTVTVEGVETSVGIVLTQILRLVQVTTDPSLLGLLSKPSVKLDWVRDWLEDNPTESVIIFTRFRDTAEKLAQEYPHAKLIVGGNRATVTPTDRLIIGTIAAMGEGLDLPWIDNAIFIDCEWSSILMQQAIDRIHRINIDTAKNIYYLRCVGTVDQLLHDALAAKWSQKEIVDRFLKGNLEYDTLSH